MKLRPYNHLEDYSYIEKWIDDERTHMLWCAALAPYPLTCAGMAAFLEKDKATWGGEAFVAVDGEGETPVGFFVRSVNRSDDSAFLKFVITDSGLRGKGYGRNMLRLALEQIFDGEGLSYAQLNVFDVNARARACYRSVGFSERGPVGSTVRFQKEKWRRINMAISRSEYEGSVN